MGGKRRGVSWQRWEMGQEQEQSQRVEEGEGEEVHPTVSAKVTALPSSLNLPLTPAEPSPGPMLSLQFAMATTSPGMKAWSWPVIRLMLTPKVEWDL